MHILDTNVAIHLRDGDSDVAQRVVTLDGRIAISILTRIELEGRVAADARQATVLRDRLDAFLAGFPVLAFETPSADVYRRIIRAAGFSRRKIIDRMIAAQAITHDAVLVTFNADDFADVPDLKILAW